MTTQVEWWDEKPKEAGQAVKEELDRVMREQDGLRRANLTHMRMYRNFAIAGLSPVGYGVAHPGYSSTPIAFNVVRTMCNEGVAKVTKLRPRPWAQTSGATVELQSKAKLLERWLLGGFWEDKLYRHGPRVVLDGMVFGTGFFKTYAIKQKLITERVFSPEIVVDMIEGMHGSPRNIYQKKYIDRGRLKRLFPKHSEYIDELEPPGAEDEEEIVALFNTRKSNMVRFEEAYHVASEDGADDGLLVQTAGGRELGRRRWEHDWHPFSVYRWDEGPLGFFGMGLAEELKGIQFELNRLLRSAQNAMHLMGNPYVLVDRGSNVVKSTITDIPGSILQYSGKPPAVAAFQTVHPEVFAHMDRLYTRAFEIARMPQQVKKQSPYTSGRAQLVSSDLESESMGVTIRCYEDLFLDIAEKRIATARDLDGYKVRMHGDMGFQTIDFKKDIDLKREDYLLRIMGSSLLGDTPAGQIDQAERLIASKVVQNPDDIIEMMDHPDMVAFTRRRLAPRKLIEKMVTTMLNGGEQQAVDPGMNLAMAADVTQLMYAEAKLNGAKEEDLRKVRNFMIGIKQQISAALPAGSPGGPGNAPLQAGGGPPVAPPGLPQGA